MSNQVVEQTNILLTVGNNELEILEFHVQEEDAEGRPGDRIYFGMNVAKVMQVIESPNLNPGQHSRHPSFLGTVPLREFILPVIDLSNWLGIRRYKTPNEVVIVTEFSQTVTGFLVSGVTEIHRVGWDEVKSPGTFLQQVGHAAIVGTVDRGDHLVQLLDMEGVLAELDPGTLEAAGTSTVRASRCYPALVADDSATIREMIEQNLKVSNFAPTIVTNGEEAWKSLTLLKLRAEAEKCDIYDLVRVVISDIEMPSMDGFTLTKLIKEDPVLGKVPVILYSSIITNELRHKGASVGADEQIAKPEIHRMAERALRLIEGEASIRA